MLKDGSRLIVFVCCTLFVALVVQFSIFCQKCCAFSKKFLKFQPQPRVVAGTL